MARSIHTDSDMTEGSISRHLLEFSVPMMIGLLFQQLYNTVDTLVVDSDKIPAEMEGCDIGPKSAALFGDAVKAARTVVWNGPMGVFENPILAKGTLSVAQAMADSEAVTIIGGGDSAAAVEQMGLGAKMTHISTGGGASLEFLEGKTLPGVACLDEK